MGRGDGWRRDGRRGDGRRGDGYRGGGCRGDACVAPTCDTAIGVLPAHWEMATVQELLDIKQGKAVSQKHRAGRNPKPFLRTANVYWGKGRPVHTGRDGLYR